MEQELNIYQRLAKIRENIGVLRKDKSGYGYKYVAPETVLANITGMMNDLHLSLVPHIIAGTTDVMPYHYMKTKASKDGKATWEEHVNEVIIKSDMEFQWVCEDKPEERVIVPWTLVGQQSDASQAFGSALTYCTRYFLMEYFNVATTEDDPDNWRSKQKEAAEREARMIAAKINEETLSIINVQLEKDASKRTETQDIVKRYAKDKTGKASPNPNLITDPEIAARLRDDIKAFFGIEKQGKDE